MRATALAVLLMVATACGAPGSGKPGHPTNRPPSPSPVAQASPGSARLVPTGMIPAPESCLLVDGRWPDPACIPGERNPAVAGEAIYTAGGNVRETVCNDAWVQQNRPPAPAQLEIELMAAEGLDGNLGDYTVDQLWPVSLGGSPDAMANLWVIPDAGPYGAGRKAEDEATLHTRLCSGAITVNQAGALIIAEWSAPR